MLQYHHNTKMSNRDGFLNGWRHKMSLNLHPLFVSFKFEIKLVSDSLDNMTTILKHIKVI